MHEIVILYHDKKTEKICKDIKKAKQELPAIVAEKLHALINLLESAENLCDISEMQIISFTSCFMEIKKECMR